MWAEAIQDEIDGNKVLTSGFYFYCYYIYIYCIFKDGLSMRVTIILGNTCSDEIISLIMLCTSF